MCACRMWSSRVPGPPVSVPVFRRRRRRRRRTVRPASPFTRCRCCLRCCCSPAPVRSSRCSPSRAAPSRTPSPVPAERQCEDWGRGVCCSSRSHWHTRTHDAHVSFASFAVRRNQSISPHFSPIPHTQTHTHENPVRCMMCERRSSALPTFPPQRF